MNKIIDRDQFQSLGDVVGKIADGIGGERAYRGGKITEAGVYAGLDIDRYHRDPEVFDGFSISSSGLRQILDRPSAYWWTSPYNPDAEEPESKPALDFGKAAHMLLLGEDGFAERYALRPEHRPDDVDKPVKERRAWSGNANDCKAWIADVQHAGKAVITQTEIGHIRNMATALRRKEAIRLGILNGRIERSIVARINGIWCKARPDVIPSASGDFVDLKTAASVDDESLSKAVFNNGYHVQAGFMRMVVREVLGPDAFTSFTFVFVEKSAPYDVRVMTLKDADIDLGERQARRGLKILSECIKRSEWPGYDGHEQHISFIEMPAWAKTRIDTALRSEAA
jgi:hypothetical protein